MTHGARDTVDSRTKCDITLAGTPSSSANISLASSSRSSSHHYHHTRLVVFLPTFWFRLAWLGLLTLQIAVAVAILHYGYLFHYFTSEGMTYYINLLGLMPSNALARIANYMLALSGWHMLMVARTVWASIRARRLVFVSLTPVGVQTKDPSQNTSSSFSSTRNLTMRCEQSLLRVYRWIWYELLGRRGVFGVESPLFDVLFVLREFIEIGSQTYQTFRLTHLVASPWITNISTLLVIVNCVSTPVVRHFFRNKPAIERAVCLAVDALLDVSTSLGIPVIIFWPYYRAFIPEIIGFTDELLFDDVWQIRALMENKQIYMTSELDCVSKLVPLVSMISSFNGIRKLIQERPPVGTIKSLGVSGKGSLHRLSVAQERRRSVLESFWEDRVASVITVRTKSRVNRFVHTLLLFWAIAVGIVHLVAVRTSYGTGEEFGCKLSTRPWLSTRFSCAVLEINCNRQKELLGGSALELGRIMKTLEGGSLASLIISHCPQLSVPPQIQCFSSLLSMEVYNSTIVAWSRTSALTQQHHPVIGLLTLVRCNMSELPEGVLVDHPRALTDITIVASNLTALPQDLDVRWMGVSSLLVEQGRFMELPAAVGRMTSLIRLSFVGNEIATIVDDAFADGMQLYTLALSSNPLTTVSVNVGSVVNFKTLYLDHTRIPQLPKWALSEAFLEAVLWVAMDQTPYCSGAKDRVVDVTSTISARAQELLVRKVRCSSEKNRIDGFFPLTQATMKRVP